VVFSFKVLRVVNKFYLKIKSSIIKSMNNLEGSSIEDKTRSREEINALVEKLNHKYKAAMVRPTSVGSDKMGRFIIEGKKPMTESELEDHIKLQHELYSPSEGEHWYDK